MSVILSGLNRPQSLYIVGNPGYGKSSLIQRLALQDIRAGRGVGVIDPTADLVNRIIHWVPKNRVKDTIYLDTVTPIGIDFFSYQDQKEREILTDELVSVFEFTTAPRAKPLARQVIGTLFDVNESDRAKKAGFKTNFLDVYRFFVDKKRQRDILFFSSDQRQMEWDDLPSPSQYEPITYRMKPFMESKTLTTMFGSEGSKTVNIWDVMQNKKILLVNLEDSETDLFAGSLLISKIQQAAFRRRLIKESSRVPFYLYIDEFQTVLEHSEKYFKKILTRARKYKLCLTLANQIFEDLPARIQSSLGTVSTLVLFQMDLKNARNFGDRISPFEPQQLVNLDKFQAVCRTGRKVTGIKTPQFLPYSPRSYAKVIQRNTILLYGVATAQDSTILSNQSASSNSGPVSHTERNAKPDPSPGQTPNIPPHGGKA